MSIEDPDTENTVNLKTTLLYYLGYALIYDDKFVKGFENSILRVVAENHNAALVALEQELAPLSKYAVINYREF